jgi:hypothetical protein
MFILHTNLVQGLLTMLKAQWGVAWGGLRLVANKTLILICIFKLMDWSIEPFQIQMYPNFFFKWTIISHHQFEHVKVKKYKFVFLKIKNDISGFQSSKTEWR